MLRDRVWPFVGLALAAVGIAIILSPVLAEMYEDIDTVSRAAFRWLMH